MTRWGCKGNYAVYITLILPHTETMREKVHNYRILSAYYEDIFVLLTRPMICGIITISFIGRGTVKIHHLPDEKSKALKQQNLLHTKASTITDELFQTLQFFDPRDLLQVKYEMVRRVLKDGWSVSRSAAAFGFSRISFYRIQRAFQTLGVLGLMPQKRGPSHPTKITEAVLVFLRQRLEQQPALSAAKLKVLLAGELGVRVHTRTIERALRGKKKLPGTPPKMRRGKP